MHSSPRMDIINHSHASFPGQKANTFVRARNLTKGSRVRSWVQPEKGRRTPSTRFPCKESNSRDLETSKTNAGELQRLLVGFQRALFDLRRNHKMPARFGLALS